MNSRHLPSPAATKIASRPTLSQFPGGPVPSGSPAAKMYRQPVEPISSLKWKTLLSFGWKLIGVCRGLVLLYAILSLTHEAIDRGIIQLSATSPTKLVLAALIASWGLILAGS